MRLLDFKGVLKTHQLPLLRSYRSIDDLFVLEFDAIGLTWRPGEHGIFSFPQKRVQGKTWRGFSISSIPSEKVIRIATHISDTPSDFKRVLKELKVGESIQIRGPFGWFYRRDEMTPVVMVAGGVGITPIISMAKEYAEKPNQSDVEIIYASPREHLFKDELIEIEQKNPKVVTTFVHKSDEVQDLLRQVISKRKNEAFYYLSGSPAFIKSLKQTMRQQGIKGSRIIADVYLGY